MDMLVRDAVAKIRSLAKTRSPASHAYVVDENRHLVGVLNMRDLMIASSTQTLAVVMRGIVMREIPKEKTGRLILKEGGLGAVNGVIIGLVMPAGRPAGGQAVAGRRDHREGDVRSLAFRITAHFIGCRAP